MFTAKKVKLLGLYPILINSLYRCDQTITSVRLSEAGNISLTLNFRAVKQKLSQQIQNMCITFKIHPLKGCVIGGRLRAMTHLGMISYQGPAGTCDGRAQVTLGYRSGGRIAVRLITSGPSDRKLVSQPFHVVPQPIWTCCVNSHIQTALAQHLHSI